jgi:eukaryotic-like serine/threonine-protein kinase
MSEDRWERLQALFAGASDLPSDERAAYLDRTTGDPDLRSEVLSLLEAAERSGRLDRIADYFTPAGKAAREDPRERLTAALGDRYRIQRELGRGGTAIVYLADDLEHQRPVALKVLRPDLTSQIGARRFLREIETAARLAHPGILPLHDSGESDGLYYYVMPYVAEESLRDRLKREPRLSLLDAVAIAREVADALGYAHNQGVIHRDIKPGNILFVEGRARVGDFGIARALDAAAGDRLTESGVTIGTPAYMSPEQASGSRATDGRSDVYSLGCVVYEMLAGEALFAWPDPRVVLRRHALEPVPPLRTIRPDVPVALQQVLERALAKPPDDRFATAPDFADALEQALQAPAPVPVPSARAGRRLWIPLGTLLTLGLIAGWWFACTATDPGAPRRPLP